MDCQAHSILQDTYIITWGLPDLYIQIHRLGTAGSSISDQHSSTQSLCALVDHQRRSSY
jgi:hypothetical protein